jgi:hypothetical protein
MRRTLWITMVLVLGPAAEAQDALPIEQLPTVADPATRLDQPGDIAMIDRSGNRYILNAPPGKVAISYLPDGRFSAYFGAYGPAPPGPPPGPSPPQPGPDPGPPAPPAPSVPEGAYGLTKFVYTQSLAAGVSVREVMGELSKSISGIIGTDPAWKSANKAYNARIAELARGGELSTPQAQVDAMNAAADGFDFASK